MHDMPSVIYEDSYKRRGKPWERGLLETLLSDLKEGLRHSD